MTMVARHLANRAPSFDVLGEAFPQPVEALGHRLTGEQCERLRAGVDLDAGDHVRVVEDLHEPAAVVCRLTDRLVEQDRSADVFADAGGREEELAVAPARVLGRVHADRVESLGDRAAGLVGGEDPFAGRHQGDRCLMHRCHRVIRLPRWNRSRPAAYRRGASSGPCVTRR